VGWWMMVYFDTNVLIYAFSKNIDDPRQKDISVKLVGEAIENESLILSELILCEFAFISNKLKENKEEIDDNLEFLSEYLKLTDVSIHQRMLEILKETSLYISSFDVYHLAFSEYYNAKLITFDKGFKKLEKLSKIELVLE
jgi:predicted nucleic acid-binding protein